MANSEEPGEQCAHIGSVGGIRIQPDDMADWRKYQKGGGGEKLIAKEPFQRRSESESP